MKLPKKRNFEAHSSKRVSFILTTKNRAEYLKKTLELHRELIHPDDELIVIDGLSTDHTSEVVNRYADIVDTFISEPDLSAMHASNKGILISQGKYIKQLTDDDVIYPEAMEQAIQVLEEHPEVDLLVCGGTRQIGDHFSAVYLPPGVNYGKRVEDVFRYGACGVGFVIRRSSLSKIGLFHPTNLVPDNEFVLRAISRGANVKFCRINLFNHPIYAHSVVVSKRYELEVDYNRLIRQYSSSWFYCWYYLTRRWLLRWLLQHPRLNGMAKALRDTVRKVFSRKRTEIGVPQYGEKTLPDDKGFLWDGGFS